MKLYIIPLYYRQSIRNYGIDSADYKEEIKSSRTKMQKTAAHIYVSKIVTLTTHFLEKDPDIKRERIYAAISFFCHLLFTVGIIFFLLVALLLNPSTAIEPNSVSMMVNPIVTENVSTIVIVTTLF
ncbi:MAG TPA: hypothetical protein VGK47_01315 [Nitrososphaeraceae archaeon]